MSDSTARPTIVLPPDIWWPLRISVAPGECTPLMSWFWWHWQFFSAQGDTA